MGTRVSAKPPHLVDHLARATDPAGKDRSMTPPRLHSLLLSSLMFLPGAVRAQGLLPAQSDAAFEAALQDRSPSPQFVAVTVVNDTSGETISGCLPANLLLGAMHREYSLDYDPDSRQRAIAAAEVAGGRTFHFRNDDAWANMPASAWSSRACQIIASGQVARIADRSGQVIAQAR
jgi:hypothetical protein